MTSQIGEISVNIKGLRQLYNRDACARLLLDYVASRKNNSLQTTVDRLEAVTSRGGADCSRRELVIALKKLEKLECGKFIIGRWGQPSRFEWAVQMIGVGRAAKGEGGTVEPLRAEEAKPEEAVDSEPAANTIRHTFNLRPDYTVTFDLPSDFGVKEAFRLAEFVKTLPFDEG